MFKYIREGKVQFPDSSRHGIHMSANCKNLISKLLITNRKKRLGSHNDIKEILQHPFFSDVNIDKMLKKELMPPYKPDNCEELQYFD